MLQVIKKCTYVCLMVVNYLVFAFMSLHHQVQRVVTCNFYLISTLKSFFIKENSCYSVGT